MGAVIAIRANGRIYLAADRMKQRLDLYWRTNAESNFKIHKVRGGVIVGAVGPLVQTQRLYLNDAWFKPPKGVAFDKRFIATSIIPKYISALVEDGVIDKGEGKSDYPHVEVSFIVVKDDAMFIIDSDFGVFEMKDIAMITTDSELDTFEGISKRLDRSDPERFLTELFAKASKLHGDLVPEIALIDTVNTEFRLLGGVK